MTYLELINNLKKSVDNIESHVIDFAIFFFSDKIKDKSSLLINLNNEIDFKYKKIHNFLIKHYTKKIPLEYLTNQSLFCSIEFYVDKNVLIPRKETEEMMLNLIDDNKKKNKFYNDVLDLCSGSGCIGITYKKYFPNSNIYLLEKSKKALNISKKNSKINNLNLNFIHDDILNFLKLPFKKFDLIISNPPYVNENYKLDEYCLKEPKQAFFASDNGLFYIKKIIDNYDHILNENGLLIIEFGYDQSKLIQSYLKLKKINFIIKKDLYNIDRYVFIENK